MAPISTRRRSDSLEQQHQDSTLLQLSINDDTLHEHNVQSATAIDNDSGSKPATKLSTAGNNSASKPTAPRKILFLDGVRGIATVLVVTQHGSYMHGVNLGHVAVDIFFVLSSFLLTMLFYKKAATLLAQQAPLRTWGYALADYASKRFLRVYPLFALTATVVWLLPYAAQHRYFFVQRPGDFALARVLTFDVRYRYHVFWTLPLEIAYYFLIPVFVLCIHGLKRAWWVACVVLSGWITYNGWFVLRTDHQSLGPHLPTFVCGSLAAIVFCKIDARIQTSKFVFERTHVYAIRAIEVVIFWLLVSVMFRSQVFQWFVSHPRPVLAGARFISVHVSALIVIELLLPSVLSEALEWSLLRHWGKIGFSVYLLHSFVLYSDVIQRQRYYYDKLVLTFFLVHVVGTVSFHLLEVPCQRVAARMSRVLARHAAAGGSTPAPLSVV